MTRVGMTIVAVMALMVTSAVSADEGVVPQGQPQKEGPPGMTQAQDATAGSIEKQALAVMQAKEVAMNPMAPAAAAAMKTPAVAAGDPAVPPVVKPGDQVGIWIDQQYAELIAEKMKKQMQDLQNNLNKLPPGAVVTETLPNGDLVIKIIMGGNVISQVVFHKKNNINIQVNVSSGGIPVVQITGGPFGTTVQILPGINVPPISFPKSGPPIMTLPNGTRVILTPEGIADYQKKMEEMIKK